MADSLSRGDLVGYVSLSPDAVQALAIYVDLGITSDMRRTAEEAVKRRIPIEVLALDREVTDFDRAAIHAARVVMGIENIVTGIVTTPERLEPEKKPHALLWLDLETTGLDPVKDRILEIAWTLTFFEHPYDERASKARIVRQAEDVRPVLSQIVLEMHEKSGLLAELDANRLLSGLDQIELRNVEAELLFLSQDWPLDKDQKVLLAGNSVAQFDLPFLRNHMPTFAARLSHRVFDASALYRNLLSFGMPAIPKVGESAHRAAKDVEASIELAKRCAAWVLEGRRAVEILEADESHNVWRDP